MEVRKIKMIITCDDGNERILEKVIKEIPKSEEMFAGETHITFDKISLGSIIIILQTESPYTKERLKYFIEKEGISTFLKHLFKARDIRKILTREKYTIEVKISEAQDETEQITDVLKSAKTSVITYRSRLERCHSFLMEELEPRCLLKDHKVADIFGPVLEKMNQPNLRTTKVNAFLEYLKNQPEEKIQIVLEKLREKNKYIYDQLFPDTTKYQDIGKIYGIFL
ncbi:uncharacterized protein LOC134233340 [Saccostrea cucullata]|uniref:uncharacterized protein LOC134233340 n=1 Tax=Saccostrea cuccullata TaxID=36930 RepID=UPI002ED55983